LIRAQRTIPLDFQNRSLLPLFEVRVVSNLAYLHPKRQALMMIRATHLFSREDAAKALAELSEEDRAEVIAQVERRR
jgi:hypothetical protein